MTSIRLRPTAMAVAEAPDPARYFTGDLLKADPSRRVDVRFDSDSVSLAGHLYRPPSALVGEPTPAVALSCAFARLSVRCTTKREMNTPVYGSTCIAPIAPDIQTVRSMTRIP